MKSIRQLYSKVLRWLLGALGVTSIAFVFQACYAPYYGDDYYHRCINGKVLSATTNKPIKGIRVTGNDQPGYVETDSAGAFHIHLPLSRDYNIRLEDQSDSLSTYLPKDTIIVDSIYNNEKIIIYLNEMRNENNK